MNKNLFVGPILGALLLTGCNDSGGAAQKERYPKPAVVTPDAQQESISYVAGYAFDPEAWFLNAFACLSAGPACPLQPITLENNPLFLASTVHGGPITMLDAAAGQPGVAPTVPELSGLWVMPQVPKSSGRGYLPLALGQGAMLPTADELTAEVGFPVPLPPVPTGNDPTGNYLPTLTLRPVEALNPTCVAVESLHTSKNGILEAVAIYLSAVEMTPTSVSDFVTPGKFGGVAIFHLYQPGFAFLKVPPLPAPTDPSMTNTTVKVLEGGPPGTKMLNIQWAPKNDPRLPPGASALQSERGYFVAPGAPTSNVGVTVALQPATTPPGTLVFYQVEDQVTDDANFRPWKAAPVPVPAIPGFIVAGSLQLGYRDAGPGFAPPPNFCLPL